jgi:hypothetical protein
MAGNLKPERPATRTRVSEKSAGQTSGHEVVFCHDVALLESLFALYSPLYSTACDTSIDAWAAQCALLCLIPCCLCRPRGVNGVSMATKFPGIIQHVCRVDLHCKVKLLWSRRSRRNLVSADFQRSFVSSRLLGGANIASDSRSSTSRTRKSLALCGHDSRSDTADRLRA